MYPMLREGVELGVRGTETKEYYAVSPEGGRYRLSAALYRALLSADGTRPLAVRTRDRRALVKRLKQAGLITTSRMVWGGAVNRLILLPVGRRGKALRKGAAAVNAALPVLSLLFVLAGGAAAVFFPPELGWDFVLASYIPMIAVSLVLHEFGHFIAALACGCFVSDVGVMLLGVFPVGAYVAYRNRDDGAGRLQIALAGIEMHLLLAGLSFLLRYPVSSWSYTLTVFAFLNLFLAALNALPCEGLDGEAALSALMRVPSIADSARDILKNARRRRRLLRSGAGGCACLCLLLSTYLAKGVVIFLFANDIFSLVCVALRFIFPA